VKRVERDAYLEQVLVGGREARAIVIVDYDASWPERFVAHRDRVARALGPMACSIEHIGSTAVPGLGAKPIIDLLVAVKDPDEESVMVPAMTAAGYQLRVREPGHRMFRTPERDVHIHVWQDTDPEIARHVKFRDRLRASAEDRAAYERLKRKLATKRWDDMNQYADVKSQLIEQILSRAID